MSFLTKIFGDANEKYIGGLQPVIEKINSLEQRLEGFSDEELRAKTEEFKERIRKGQTLDDILPEAFALAREASKRTLKQRHFDVQLIGGIVLHQGKIAEMKTGEGKTLTATLALYLNALTGEGCHLVTVNDYLARRDAVWMGQIYSFLGLSVGCINHDQSFLYDPAFKKQDEDKDKMRDELGAFKVVEDFLRPSSRKEAYGADITYGTNNEYGFDYLRDNMVYDLKDQVQRGFNFAIVDEVDSILIDEARTPLIISAPDTESSKMYSEFARIIPQLDPNVDYEIDEKMRAATITEHGIERVEEILGMKDIYQEKGIRYLHHLEQSLRAQAINSKTGQPLFARDRDYIVKDGQVIIVDEFTGRVMPGRRWSGGLHQAIEAKEGVAIQPESLTLGSITFQNYFRLYKKLAGMTGTAATSAEEFEKVYKLDTAMIPTHLPMVRSDLADKIYKTREGKFKAVVRAIKEMHEKGQPVLVGTVSIEKNEYLGKLLDREGIPHKILNAKHHEEEGQIIAQAGRFGAVTIATNMAGRGVDIILGGNPPDPNEATKVREQGGLHVIGTERHEARRIDNQLRGRAGRQGDPGSSQFFISLEDDLMRIFGGDRIKSLMEMLKIPEDEAIEAKMVSGVIESAQAKIEGANFDLRKHVLDYDDVLNKHRDVIYKKRKEILAKAQEGTLKDAILEMAKNAGASEEEFAKKEKEMGSDNMRNLEKLASLRILDFLWMEHLDNMEHLRDTVRLRAYGQRDPLIEYKGEARLMFQNLLKTMESSIVQSIIKAEVREQKNPVSNFVSQTKSLPANDSNKSIGRNDPCPCGAKHPDGRSIKYKHCHGRL